MRWPSGLSGRLDLGPRAKGAGQLLQEEMSCIFSFGRIIQVFPAGGGNLMILGMTTFTFVHVLLSLIGILSGFAVVFGLLGGKRLDGWTALFLVTTVLTSVTGFLFPFHKFLPSHGIGIVSLVVLAIAIFARYARQLAGGWRRGYAVSAV